MKRRDAVIIGSIGFILLPLSILFTNATQIEQSELADVIFYDTPAGVDSLLDPYMHVSINGKSSLIYNMLTRGKVYCNSQGENCIDTVPTRFTYFQMSPSISGQTKVNVELNFRSVVRSVRVSPERAGVSASHSPYKVTFTLPRAGHYLVHLNDDDGSIPPVAIFANPIETNKPDPHDPDVMFFSAGKIHDVGLINITKNNQTIYIEGGAIVLAAIKAENVENLTVKGHGILLYDDHVGENSAIKYRWGLFNIFKSTAILIKDIIAVESTTRFGEPGRSGPTAPWAILIPQSSNVRISNLKLLSELRDGIDLDGTHDVHIANSYVQAGDDAICIKATPYGMTGGGRDVYNILVEQTQIFETAAGAALEIGNELFNKEIYNVSYHKIDIMGALRASHAISVWVAAPSTVHDILFNDIKIEQQDSPGVIKLAVTEVPNYEKQMALRHTETIPAPEPGKIEGIRLKDIAIDARAFKTSIISGLNEDKNAVLDVDFNNLSIDGKKILAPEEGKFTIINSKNITFH